MKKEERIARQKRLARAIQVREAQRRRRARLKNENQKFLQIIVPDALREAIFEYGTENDLTLQEAAVVLIEKALDFPSGGHRVTFTRSKPAPVPVSNDGDKPAPVAPVVVPIMAEPVAAPVAVPVAAVVAPIEVPAAAVAVVAVAEETAADSDPVWDVADEDDGQMSLF